MANNSSAGWTRARVGAVLTPIVVLALSVLPLPLEGPARRLVPIVGGVLVAWVTEVVPIPVTALLIAPVMVLAGVCDKGAAFAPYASPILFIFVGGFMIAHAMQLHGLDRRIAMSVLSLGPVGKSAARTRAALMITGAMLSMWISNTATTAILLPILMGTLPTEGDAETRARNESGGVLAVAYACSVGGLGTVVGSPPNLITLEMLERADVTLSFIDWMKVGLPSAFVFVGLVMAYLHLAHPPLAAGEQGLKVEPRGPMSRAEKVTALSFALAVTGWMLPGVARALDLSVAGTLRAHLPAGGVALVAASVLFMVPRGDESEERVLPWREATKIDWGLIMLFGGGISMGKQMFDSGLAGALGRGFIELTGVSDMWTLVALVAFFTLFFTEMCSNTATANMLAPLVIGVARELNLSPVPPALAVGLAASCAFMLPVATGPNAIAYASGKVPLPQMIRTGSILNVLCAAAIVLLLWLLCPIFGWT